MDDEGLYPEELDLGLLHTARFDSTGADQDAQDATGSLARRLAGLPDSDRYVAVLELVRSQMAAVLGDALPDPL